MSRAPFVRWAGGLKEPFNALSHLVGALLAAVGTIWLLAVAVGRPWHLMAAAIYGAASITLFVASTLLHAVRGRPERVERLRRADHAAIFVLIAGSYTPVALVSLRESGSPWAWPLFITVWVLAVAGVVFKLRWFGGPRWLSTALYVGMGWLAVVAIRPLALSVPTEGIVLLAVGGLLYSVGAVVYALKRPDPAPRTIGYHGLWHLFVLAGWAAHFAMMALYVLAG